MHELRLCASLEPHWSHPQLLLLQHDSPTLVCCCRRLHTSLTAFQTRFREHLKTLLKRRSHDIRGGWVYTNSNRVFVIAGTYALVLAYIALCVYVLLLFGKCIAECSFGLILSAFFASFSWRLCRLCQYELNYACILYSQLICMLGLLLMRFCDLACD
jgi:hypothetical protein